MQTDVLYFSDGVPWRGGAGTWSCPPYTIEKYDGYFHTFIQQDKTHDGVVTSKDVLFGPMQGSLVDAIKFCEAHRKNVK